MWLDLGVGREQADAELGRLIEAEGDDAGALGDPKGGERLASDRELAAHLLHLSLAWQWHEAIRREGGEHVRDVGVDGARRRAARELRPHERARLPRHRLVPP